MLAVAAAAAALAKFARPETAEAGHDGVTAYSATNVLHPGVINDGGNGANDETATILNARTALVADISGGANAAFRVRNLGAGDAGIHAFGLTPGGDGVVGTGGEMAGASGADDGRGVVGTGGSATVTGVNGGIGVDAVGARELGWYLGLWHDTGKFDPAWQQYLIDAEAGRVRPGTGPDHRAAGTSLMSTESSRISLAVHGHHGGLRTTDFVRAELILLGVV